MTQYITFPSSSSTSPSDPTRPLSPTVPQPRAYTPISKPAEDGPGPSAGMRRNLSQSQSNKQMQRLGGDQYRYQDQPHGNGNPGETSSSSSGNPNPNRQGDRPAPFRRNTVQNYSTLKSPSTAGPSSSSASMNVMAGLGMASAGREDQLMPGAGAGAGKGKMKRKSVSGRNSRSGSIVQPLGLAQVQSSTTASGSGKANELYAFPSYTPNPPTPSTSTHFPTSSSSGYLPRISLSPRNPSHDYNYSHNQNYNAPYSPSGHAYESIETRMAQCPSSSANSSATNSSISTRHGAGNEGGRGYDSPQGSGFRSTVLEPRQGLGAELSLGVRPGVGKGYTRRSFSGIGSGNYREVELEEEVVKPSRKNRGSLDAARTMDVGSSGGGGGGGGGGLGTSGWYGKFMRRNTQERVDISDDAAGKRSRDGSADRMRQVDRGIRITTSPSTPSTAFPLSAPPITSSSRSNSHNNLNSIGNSRQTTPHPLPYPHSPFSFNVESADADSDAEPGAMMRRSSSNGNGKGKSKSMSFAKAPMMMGGAGGAGGGGMGLVQGLNEGRRLVVPVVGRRAGVGVKGAEEGEEVLEAKVVLLGSQGVGKSTLARRYAEGTFSPTSTRPTVNTSLFTRKLNWEGGEVRLQIWDTVGEERHRSLTKLYYRGAQAAIIVYDITSESSFADVESWLTELRNMTDGVLIFIVGAKYDLAKEGQRKVERKRARLTVAKWLGLQVEEDGLDISRMNSPPPTSSGIQSPISAGGSRSRQTSLFRSNTVPTPLEMKQTGQSGSTPTRPAPYKFMSLLGPQPTPQLDEPESKRNLPAGSRAITGTRSNSVSATALMSISLGNSSALNSPLPTSTSTSGLNLMSATSVAPRRKSEDWSASTARGEALRAIQNADAAESNSKRRSGDFSFGEDSWKIREKKAEAKEEEARKRADDLFEEDPYWGRRITGTNVRVGEVSSKLNRGVDDLFASMTAQLALRRRQINLERIRKQRESVYLDSNSDEGGQSGNNSSKAASSSCCGT